MAMVNLCYRLVSCYGKERFASRTANPIVFTKHDHIFNRNVKPEPLRVVMGTYELLSRCVRNISSRGASNENEKPLENAASKKGSNVSSNEVHGDVNYLDMANFAVEQHNRENGTKLKILENGKTPLVEFSVPSNHVKYINLVLKVIDEKGKVAYVKAHLTSRRDAELEAAPLVYLTNQILRNFKTTIPECFH